MSVLKNRGHQVYFSDEYLKPTNILESDFINDNRIDVVGIYSNTICYKSTISMLEKLQNQRLKKKWRGRIIVGGPHTSVAPDDIPDYVDHIVIGEGEVSLLKILDGEENSRIVKGEQTENLDDLPMPAWEEFLYRPYHWGHHWHDVYPLYTMNTSRGCPFSCSFCSVGSIWGRTYRYISAERIIDQVQHMVKYYGAKGIYFREDHFTLNKKRTTEFCELLIKKNLKIDWLCETRADQICDKEYVQLMHASGCKAFYIGVESGSPRMLEMYKKGISVDQIIKCFRIAREVGIKTYASFIVGFPTETKQDKQLTNSLIKVIQPDFVGKNVFVGIPGSELYDYIRNHQLYEHEDELHILYPIDYLQNTKRYYRNDPYYLVYGSYYQQVAGACRQNISKLGKALRATLGKKL